MKKKNKYRKDRTLFYASLCSLIMYLFFKFLPLILCSKDCAFFSSSNYGLKCSRREHIKYMFLIHFLNFIFNWRIIALQYLFDICHTSTWISHGCTDVLSFLNHPPTSHPFPLLWVVTEPLLLLSHFSRVRLCVTPQMAAHQAPLSLGFSRQEHWSGLPFPSPIHESEKWKWSRSVVSDSATPWTAAHQASCPWDFPGKSTGVGCHCLLQSPSYT